MLKTQKGGFQTKKDKVLTSIIMWQEGVRPMREVLVLRRNISLLQVNFPKLIGRIFNFSYRTAIWFFFLTVKKGEFLFFFFFF